MSKEAPPLMNIYAITNVAAVAEEVIEGVYAGQIYQDISSSDISDFLAGSRKKKVDRSIISRLGSSIGKSGVEFPAIKEIEVVLDIAHEDFTFSAQPGALRRVSCPTKFVFSPTDLAMSIIIFSHLFFRTLIFVSGCQDRQLTEIDFHERVRQCLEGQSRS